MISDATTFFLSFLAVFAGLAAYLWHLDRAARRLEARLATLEAASASAASATAGSSGTAKPKPGGGPVDRQG
jgi:CcmD family protein